MELHSVLLKPFQTSSPLDLLADLHIFVCTHTRRRKILLDSDHAGIPLKMHIHDSGINDASTASQLLCVSRASLRYSRRIWSIIRLPDAPWGHNRLKKGARAGSGGGGVAPAGFETAPSGTKRGTGALATRPQPLHCFNHFLHNLHLT